jgi:hypothetical protein
MIDAEEDREGKRKADELILRNNRKLLDRQKDNHTASFILLGQLA